LKKLFYCVDSRFEECYNDRKSTTKKPLVLKFSGNWSNKAVKMLK